MRTNKEWALVTGASQGIGYEFSKQLAALEYNLVMVSNQKEKGIQAAEALAKTYKIDARALFIDLSENDAAEKVVSYCKDKDIKILINNAGVFTFKPFLNHSPSEIHLYINLHLRTLTDLSYFFALQFKERGGGYIINMSSLAAHFSFPGIALYEASKAYILTLSKTLWYEFKDSGVNITAICPGGANTSLYKLKSSMLLMGVKLGILISVEKLVKKSLKAMFKGKRTLTPGLINIICIPFIKALPTFIILFIKRKLQKYEWR